MTRLLDLLARVVARAPAVTLAVLTLVTVAFGAAIALLEVDTSIENFAPTDGTAATLEEIEDRFATSSSVQVLVDAGPGGNVLTPTALSDVEGLAERLEDHPDIAPVLVEGAIDAPPVVSFALPFAAAADVLGSELADLDEATFAPLAGAILDAGGDEVAGLFSDDLATDPVRARAGLVIVGLDPTIGGDALRQAQRTVADVVDETPVGDARRSTLSLFAIEEGIEAALQRDLPVLLAVSLLLVVGVLAWLFRSVVDVAVGLIGLLASIIWMTGIAALLGPGVLGWIGPFNQISIAVPVVLVGLGIDYSVHLTTRYREQRRLGDRAEQAARVALLSVGVALVLATIASVAGFLANAVTPLAAIRDFGIFAAIGIVAAFLIMATSVPAARVLVDRRLDRRHERADALAYGGGLQRTGERAVEPPRWSTPAIALATRFPVAVLAVTALLLVGAGVAASGLSTEFDERDFLPDGEPVLATIDRLDRSFGGDVSERTFLLVDGDPRDPALLAAVAQTEARLAAIDDVRVSDGVAERTSPIELRDRIVAAGGAVRERLADELETWRDPDAAAAVVALPDPLDLDALVDDDAVLAEQLDLPDDLRLQLLLRLPAGREPLRALAATADPDQIEAAVREQLAAGFAADRPLVLGDDALDALAALEPDELTLARLAVEGFPLAALDVHDRERLEQLEALEAAGATDAVDGEVLRAHVDVLAATAPRDLAAVLDDDGLLLTVATRAGQDRASEIAAALQAASDPIESAGGRVTIASDPLVAAEIIEELSAAQLVAIAISLTAAAALLAIAMYASIRVVGLGLIGIVPSVVSLVLVLGLMRLFGLAFNALTATVASIAVGIGVPYGIHLTNRFREALGRGLDPDRAIGDSLANTGPALVGSAATTGLAFAVLLLSGSVPLRQFGGVSTMMIVAALLACLLVQPALLVLWARRRSAVGDLGQLDPAA
ncbi:MAG: efflux RND transporter permease subunit [Nitriliruptoraceae bacterium]